jgi:hypothetical protein
MPYLSTDLDTILGDVILIMMFDASVTWQSLRIEDTLLECPVRL